MKKFAAFVLCLIMTACCLGVHAEEAPAFYAVAEEFTYFHWAFFELKGGYEPDVHYPIYMLEGHGYGDYAAFRSRDEFVDVVFIPDETGAGISEIHLLTDASYFATPDSYDEANLLYIHTVAVLFPFVMEQVAFDVDSTFAYEIMDAMAGAAANSYTGSYSSEGVRYADLATVTVYINGDTYGIMIEFDYPITSEILAERAYLVAMALSDE